MIERKALKIVRETSGVVRQYRSIPKSSTHARARHSNPLERGKKRKKNPLRKYETRNATGGHTTVSFFSMKF